MKFRQIHHILFLCGKPKKLLHRILFTACYSTPWALTGPLTQGQRWEHLRSSPPRERRLKAGKMLQWSILSESLSSFAAKACEARRMSVSEGSINLTPPFFDVPKRQSRWTVVFNGTSIKGDVAVGFAEPPDGGKYGRTENWKTD